MDKFQAEFIKYLESYKGSKADAAIDYIKQLSQQMYLTDEQKRYMLEKLNSTPTQEELKRNYIIEQIMNTDSVLPTSVASALTDMSVQYYGLNEREYGGINVGKVLQEVENIRKMQNINREEAAAQVYVKYKSQGIPEEQRIGILKLLSDYTDLLNVQQEESKYQKKFIEMADKHTGSGKLIEPIFIEAEKYMRENAITDKKDAVGKFLYYKYSLSDMPKGKESDIIYTVKKAADKAVPQNILDYEMPKLSHFLESVSPERAREAGRAYFLAIKPLLIEKGYTVDEAKKLYENIMEVCDLYTEEKSNPKVLQAIKGMFEIPYISDTYILEHDINDIDYESRKLFAEALKYMYAGTEFSFDIGYNPKYTQLAKNIAINATWALAATGGFIVKTGLQAAKKEVIKKLAYETVDAFGAGLPSLALGGKNLAKMALKKRAFEKMIREYEPIATKIAEAAVENAQITLDNFKKSAIDPDLLKNNIKQFLIEKKALGQEIPEEEAITMLAKFNPKAVEKVRDVEAYWKALNNIKKIYGEEYTRDMIVEGIKEPPLVGGNMVYMMSKQGGELYTTFKNIYGEDFANNLVENLWQTQGYKSINELRELFGEEAIIPEIGTAKGYKPPKSIYRTGKALGQTGRAGRLMKVKSYESAATPMSAEEFIEQYIKETEAALNMVKTFDSEKLGKEIYDYFVKPIKTNLREKFGLLGDFTAWLLEKIDNEAGNVAASIITKSRLAGNFLFRDFGESIKNYQKTLEGLPEEELAKREIDTIYGKMKLSEVRKLNVALKKDKVKNYEELYEMVMRDAVKLQFGDVAEMSEGYKALVIDLCKRYFDEIGDMAKAARVPVYNRQLKEALGVMKKGDYYVIYNKKNDYVYPEKYYHKYEAERALKELTEREFEKLPNYRPLYVNFKKILEDTKKLGDILLDVKDTHRAKELAEVLSEGDEGEKILLHEVKKLLSDSEREAYEAADGLGRMKIIADKIKSNAKLYERYVNRIARYFQNYEKRIYERKYGHLQYERVAWLPQEYYITENLHMHDMNYLYRAAKRIVEIKNLGAKDEVLALIHKGIEEDYGLKAGREYLRYKEIIFGRYGYNKMADKFLTWLGTYQIITKMPLSAPAQFMQITYAPARTSMKSFIQAITSYVRKGEREKIKAMLDQIDTTIVNLRSFQAREEVNISRAANLALKYYGINAADMASRNIAATTGYYYAKELVEKFELDPEKYVSYIIDANLDPAKLIRNGYKLDAEDIKNVMQKIEIDTNFRNRVLDMPEFVSSRTGKFITALQRTAYRQAYFIHKYIVKELIKGNPFPLINFAVVGYITSQPRLIIRSYINGEEYDPNFLKSLIDAGLFYGVYGNMLESIRVGLIPYGAHVGTVVNLGTRVLPALANLDAEKALMYGLKEFPLLYKTLYRERVLEAAKRRKKAEEKESEVKIREKYRIKVREQYRYKW